MLKSRFHLCLRVTSNLEGRGFLLTPALEPQTLSGLGCFSCGASTETGKVQRLHNRKVIPESPLSVGGFTVESVCMKKGNKESCQEFVPGVFLGAVGTNQ